MIGLPADHDIQEPPTISEQRTTVSYCVVLPGYQEERHIGSTVSAVRRFVPDVIVVDDGSTDRTAPEAEAAGAYVIRHGENRGKGAALRTGLRHVLDRGYDVVIVMDADGQHAAADIANLVRVRETTGAPVVVGNRMEHPGAMPLVRRLTNRFMSWLLSRRMGQRVPDTQNGFRLYAAAVLPIVMGGEGDRFDAESEMLLDLADAGVQIASAPTRIIYGEERSKIRPVRDTIRFFAMLHRHKKVSGSRFQGRGGNGD